MNLQVVKKKLREEVLINKRGGRNKIHVIAHRLVALSFKVIAGLILSTFLGPISLFCSIEIWLMKLGPDKASHFIDGIDKHLLRLDSLQKHGPTINIVIWPQKFPNEALAKMYRRAFYIIGPRQKMLARVLPFVIWKVLVRKHEVNTIIRKGSFDIQLKSPSIRLSVAEEKLGNEIMDNGKEFVLFGYPSSEYRKMVDQKWHSDDDLETQIPNPVSFLPIIRNLAERNIAFVAQSHTGEHDPELLSAGMIIPRQISTQPGLTDVWLASKCKFLISACTGSWWFGVPFRKAAVITDRYTPIGLQPWHNVIAIHQLAWLVKEKRFASFGWMSENYRWCFDKRRLGVDYVIVKNSPEQIIDVVEEQIARMNGTWIETADDFELQERFNKDVLGLSSNFSYLPRIGAKFLREHQHLLSD